MKLLTAGTAPFLLLLGACATNAVNPTESSLPAHENVPNPHFASIAEADNKLERDRHAILAMQGNFRVGFHFQETVPLKAGYVHRDEKNSGGFETVIVVEDSDDRLILQHLLVMGGHVIKHWRQDWRFEAKDRFEFVADQLWEVRPIPAEKTAGAWTQCVYEVSDAPRYCGTGRWNHRYGVSTWTSDRTWRPLPRREYTVRSDYNAINAENRHTITPQGWTHEQDNTKTLRDGRQTAETLVREFGFNDYRSIEGYDFSPATDYWADTAEYWSRVRAAWDKRLVAGSLLQLRTEIDGMPIITGTFEQADKATETTREEQLAAIEALLSEWTELEGPQWSAIRSAIR